MQTAGSGCHGNHDVRIWSAIDYKHVIGSLDPIYYDNIVAGSISKTLWENTNNLPLNYDNDIQVDYEDKAIDLIFYKSVLDGIYVLQLFW